MAKAPTNAEICERLAKLETGQDDVCRRLDLVEKSTKQSDKHLNEQYDQICQRLARGETKAEERDKHLNNQLDRLGDNLAGVEMLLRGDGDSDDKPGMKRRLEGCETKLEQRDRSIAWLWKTMTGVIVAAIGATVAAIWRFFTHPNL